MKEMKEIATIYLRKRKALGEKPEVRLICQIGEMTTSAQIGHEVSISRLVYWLGEQLESLEQPLKELAKELLEEDPSEEKE